MNGDIQAHEVNKGLVIAKSKQRGEIVGIIFSRVDCGEFSLTKDVAVNSTRNIGELGDPGRSLSANSTDSE